MPVQTLTAPPPVKSKIQYIDNLRVLLTVLVILHHTAICYGAPGGWYYKQPTNNTGALIAMTLFVATNQAFFMGFFFFLSALFTEASYIKKGAGKFVADRLKRLGLPLLFYSFILGPILNYLVYAYGLGKQATFLQFISGYDDWIDFGVTWFVAALLLFTLLYVLWQKAGINKKVKKVSLPRNAVILLFATALGLVSFGVRFFFPVGWVLHPVGFQLGHFTQYIALFCIGIVAGRNNWLNDIDKKRGRDWLILSIVLVLVIFPSFYAVKEATHSPLDAFQGNGSWQSLLSAVWEQLTGISIIMTLLCITKFRWNSSSPLLQKMARAAFATYILHPLVVIVCTIALKSLAIDPALKLLIAAPVVVPCSFLLGSLAVKIPGVKNVV